MTWEVVAPEHWCEKPHDWSSMGDGSVWRCPDCGQRWMVRCQSPYSATMDRVGDAFERWLLGQTRPARRKSS